MNSGFSEILDKVKNRHKDGLFVKRWENKSRYSILREGMPKKILIHGIPFLITIDGKDKLQVLKGKSILIQDGIISEIFDSQKFSGALLKKIDLIYDAELRGGIVVTPGFVNTHAHPPMYLLRSTLTFSEDNLDETLKGMAQLEGKMKEEDFLLGALGDFTEQQRSGITTTLSHYGVFEPIDQAAQATKQNVINALSAVSNSHPQNSPALVEKYLKNKNHCYTQPAMAIHELAKASPSVLKRIAQLQKKYRALFTLHLAETKESNERCYERHHDLPVLVLEKYGLLNHLTLLSHAIHLTKREILLIKKRKAGVIHLPTSNLLHKSGHFNYPLFHELKATDRIALGTDSVVSKSRLDLLTEALQTKTMHQEKRIVPYEDLFNMITGQGAKIIGLPKTGKIIPGFRADLAFWKLKDRGFLPYDPDQPLTLVSNMITHGGRNVRDLMINGDFVISNRRHNLIDESELLLQLQEAHIKLRKR